VEISKVPFGTTDWSAVEPTVHPGETGTATWQGHILLCLEGELHTELADGRTFVLTPGTSYQVGDNAEAHRSRAIGRVKLFIVD
jgi:hypothetical protein